ncbi:site-specific integrase [Hafnia paralvei]|uniref:site-specific integrase n=1 Tax=Hafnia paralvei TaxID=546367 RepID=UPI002FDC66E3
MKRRLKEATLEKALDVYLKQVTKNKKGELQEFYRINVIKRYAIAKKKMHEISSIDIAKYRDERLNTVNFKTGRKLSGNTVRLEMALLSSVFKLSIIEWGFCRENPLILVTKPKPSKGRERRLKGREEKMLLSYFESKGNHEMAMIITLAISTAMRQGELLSLDWSNINVSRRFATLYDTKNGDDRTVPLNNIAIGCLTNCGIRQEGAVFRYTSNGLKSAWRTALINLKIDDLHFHDLRHEAISRLVELGTLNLMEISSISGHKSLSMLKRYTHLNVTTLANKLDKKPKKKKIVFDKYPARITYKNESEVIVNFIDFHDLSSIVLPLENHEKQAATILLKEIAVRYQSNGFVPKASKVSNEDIIFINPLM